MSGFGGFGTTPGGLFGAKPPDQTPASTATGLTFGSTAFGTPATAAPTFGSTLFGTSSASTPFGAGTSTFTNPATGAAPATGFTFGTPSTGTLGTPTFGAPVTSTATLGTNLNFNLPKTTASTFSTPLTTTTTTASFTFGQQNQTTTPSLSFGLGQATTATTSQTTGFTFSQQPATSLSFGAPKTTANFSFGTTSTFSTPQTSTTFRFTTPATTTTATTGLTLGGTTDASKVGTPGLGGVDKSQLNQGLSGGGTIEPKQVKDNVLPDQILQTLNDFQNFTKQQKSISVEISHGSSKPLKKVQEDTDVMESLLAMITSGLTRNALAVDKLKTETAQGLHQAEMAQRNHETPPGLDYDSTAPAEYFNDLVTKFETDTMRLRVQIEASEKHLRSLTQSNTISPQELTLAMRRLHETLVVLAARVQTLHTTVQSQKEQYRNLRRVYLKDDSAIFDKDADHQHGRKQTIFSLHSLTGPTPFSETTGSARPLNLDGLAMLAGTTATPIISTAASQG
ncbi:UNVERIFIED_CONTAM: hypothetical protein PYX00_005992 [Menopon gallinae]